MNFLQSQSSQSRMVVGPSTECPMKFAFSLTDRMFIDAGKSQFHQACCVELPVLIPVGAEPLPAVVVILVGKAHSDPVCPETPELLDQSIVELPSPFPDQESFNLCAATRELCPVSPSAIRRIGEHHCCWVARVPCILCRANLLGRCLFRKGWQWRPTHARRASAMARVSMYWRKRVIRPFLTVHTCA